jgi:23S rRNA (cytidine1920-2'-O)/16S rRNA (cytidine1409-2'-O)-methyltransferase
VTKRTRLDTLLVVRGLAPSRERAQALILAGQVRVAGHRADKASTLVDEHTDVTLDVPDHPYVGRGALKLEHALDAFGLDVEARVTLDVGASTGGFTDVLLRRGASSVTALDVGHNQLDWRLRSDPRVRVMEGVNARSLTPDRFGDGPRRFGTITVDVAFISLRLVLPALVDLLEPDGDLVALIKPQFEAGRDEVGPGGIVRDADVHTRVVGAVVDEARRLGFVVAGLTPSPITGVEGNREFLVHLKRP